MHSKGVWKSIHIGERCDLDFGPYVGISPYHGRILWRKRKSAQVQIHFRDFAEGKEEIAVTEHIGWVGRLEPASRSHSTWDTHTPCAFLIALTKI